MEDSYKGMRENYCDAGGERETAAFPLLPADLGLVRCRKGAR